MTDTTPTGPSGTSPGGPAGAAPGDGDGRDVELTLGGKPSGLRNPDRAMRGLGAGTLVLEAVVLLLTLAPIRMVDDGIDDATLAVIFGGAAAAVFIGASLRRRWAWWFGSMLQVGLLAAGYLHWMLAAVGVIFGLAWVYVLYVRRTVLG